MSFTTVTLSGTYEASPGVPAVGKIQFALTTDMSDGVNTIVAGVPIVVTLDSNGSFSLNLFATDDSTTTPANVTYVVTEEFKTTPQIVQRSYNIILTHSAPTQNIAAISPSLAQIPLFNYITQSAADARYAPIGGGGGGSTLVPTAVKTANYTLAVNDLARMSAAGASRVATLPTAPADKSQCGVEVVAIAGSNTVTVQCGGSDTLLAAGGATSLVMHALGDVIILEYTASGATWNILSFTPFTPSDIGALAVASNLSDVADVGSSRVNLHVGIYTAVVVSTTNLPLTGLPTIDGYTVQHNDRVLCVGQSNGAQNGVQMAPASGTGAWGRPTDMPTGALLTGRVCYVSGGTLLAGTLWGLETTGLLTVDTSAQTWVSEYALSQGLAAVATSGAMADLTGLVSYAQMESSGCFTITWDGTTAKNALGATITARPTNRTDLTMFVKGGPSATPVSFPLTGDVYFPTS